MLHGPKSSGDTSSSVQMEALILQIKMLCTKSATSLEHCRQAGLARLV